MLSNDNGHFLKLYYISILGAPPPPPPIPTNLFDDLKIEENTEKQAKNALLADLNKGEGVTSGLKKVTSDMQTHKNPALRGTSTVPAGAVKSGSPKPAKTFGAPTTANKPPKFELEGRKWTVEFHKNNPNMEIDNPETNQSVYVYKCEGSTLKVNGKVNNIVVDGCKKVAVVFDNVVSSCEFINCQSVQMQVILKSIIFTILCQLQGRKGLSEKVSLAFFDLIDCMKSFLLSEKFKL